MLYSHVTLLMLRVVDVVAKTTVQQSARMLVAEIPGEIQEHPSDLDKATPEGRIAGSILSSSHVALRLLEKHALLSDNSWIIANGFGYGTCWSQDAGVGRSVWRDEGAVKAKSALCYVGASATYLERLIPENMITTLERIDGDKCAAEAILLLEHFFYAAC
ncbi:hypothetical protein ANCDUO_09245 [Ancylostoma duodenale]|uniref:Uncharacterized protein n=1 Tax=Ancylostoma duodenale TaxID=51022 RepID=A0A0C2GTM0_9BILA|nr:hypothetical protein ANCDUO_09245 [Ancylostoma duodenale]